MRAPRLLAVACFVLLAPVVVAMAAFAPSASAQATTATCSTFDASNEPSTTFHGGDRIVIRGSGFGASSLVLVSLQQDTRTVEIARVSANDLGGFSLSNGVIPETVASGKAAIRAIDARGSATCELTLQASAGSRSSMNGVYLIWGLILAAFGTFLGVLTYRRWKAERLNEAVDSFDWGERNESAEWPAMLADETSVEDIPVVGVGEPPLVPPLVPVALVPVARVPVAAAEGDLGRFAFEEEEEDDDGDVDVDDGRPLFFLESDDPDSEDVNAASSEPQSEPPVLPVGWDGGRLSPSRQPSDAISRLRREVRTWKNG